MVFWAHIDIGLFVDMDRQIYVLFENFPGPAL